MGSGKRTVTATAIATAVAASVIAGPAGPLAAAQPVRTVTAVYQVTFLGIPVYEARFVATVGRRTYTATAFARSIGILEALARSRIHIAADGRIHRGEYRPGTVRQRFQFRRSKQRRITMSYPAGRPVRAEIVPPESPGKRRPVPDTLRTNTLDPLTALLNAVMSPLDARPCVYVAKVFDGRRRVDAWLRYVGVGRTPRAPVKALPGRAVVCTLHANRRAGFAPKHMRQMPELRPAYLWVVRMKDARLWLPVHLRLATRWGAINARLVSFTAVDKQRAATGDRPAAGPSADAAPRGAMELPVGP